MSDLADERLDGALDLLGDGRLVRGRGGVAGLAGRSRASVLVLVGLWKRGRARRCQRVSRQSSDQRARGGDGRRTWRRAFSVSVVLTWSSGRVLPTCVPWPVVGLRASFFEWSEEGR